MNEVMCQDALEEKKPIPFSISFTQSTLKLENLKLREEVKTLQGSVKKLEEDLNQTCRMYEEKLKVSEKSLNNLVDVHKQRSFSTCRAA